MVDFRYIFFGEHLRNDPTDCRFDIPICGFQSSVKSFEIPGQPVEGYFLVGLRHLQNKTYRTLINGQHIQHQVLNLVVNNTMCGFPT